MPSRPANTNNPLALVHLEAVNLLEVTPRNFGILPRTIFVFPGLGVMVKRSRLFPMILKRSRDWLIHPC